VKNGMLYIHGVGHFHPPNVLDNHFFESLDIDTNDEWITSRVGIHTRRTVLPLDYIRHTRNQDTREALRVAEYSNAETGKLAAEVALENAGLKADQIGMVIVGGCSPDMTTPAEACAVAEALGIEADSFDLNTACSSFGSHMHFLLRMQPERLPEFVLLVSPENNTRTVDYNDRNSCVLWGDGTSAVVVSTKVASSAKVTSTTVTSNPGGWRKVVIPRGGHFRQEGSAVQNFAIKRTVATLREIHEEWGGSSGRSYFIGHQANLTMLQSVCTRCEVSADDHLYNVDKFDSTFRSKHLCVEIFYSS